MILWQLWILYWTVPFAKCKYHILEEAYENTIVVNSADNFDTIKDTLDKCKLIDIDNFLQKKSNLNANYVGNKKNLFMKKKQFHYFKILNDGNLEWINSRGDVSDLEGYQLTNKYSRDENSL